MKNCYLKLNLYILLFIISSLHVFAQDTIFYKNATRIVVLVKEVSQTEVQYKKMEMPDGPMYIINKNDIDKIVYKNGYVDIVKAPVVETVVSQPFTVSHATTINLNHEKIIYADTKLRYYKLVELIDRHPDPSRRDGLMLSARKLNHLKHHQDGTRTGAIIFGGIAIGGAVVYSLISSVSYYSYVDPVYAVPPVLFGSLAVILGSASIAININLKQKRREFVNYYNQ